jgi:hypothetical protein
VNEDLEFKPAKEKSYNFTQWERGVNSSLIKLGGVGRIAQG